MDRRRFVSTITSISIVGLAGCSAAGNDIEGVEYEGETLVASLEEDHDVSTLEVLAEDGSRIYSTNVGTETRVELFDVISGRNSFTDDDIDDPIQTLTVRAVDSEEESVGEVETEYAPDLEIEDVEIDLSEAQIEFTVTNAGEGPIEVDPRVGFEAKEIPTQIEINDNTPLEFPHSDQTEFDEPAFSDDTAVVLSSGESEQITLEDDPIIGHDTDLDTENLSTPRPGDYLQNMGVEEPVESDTIPLDTEEITIELTIESNAEPEETTKNYVSDVVFSDITVYRDLGIDQLGGDYSYTVEVIPENAEVTSFGPVE